MVVLVVARVLVLLHLLVTLHRQVRHKEMVVEQEQQQEILVVVVEAVLMVLAVQELQTAVQAVMAQHLALVGLL
jgi:hypothetical protein